MTGLEISTNGIKISWREIDHGQFFLLFVKEKCYTSQQYL